MKALPNQEKSYSTKLVMSVTLLYGFSELERWLRIDRVMVVGIL